MSTQSASTAYQDPAWFAELFAASPPKAEGDQTTIAGRDYVRKGGLVRERALISATQRQTEETFGFKWKKRDTFDSPAVRDRGRQWLLDRYGDVANAPWLKDGMVVVDAGCGAGFSGLEVFRNALNRIRYVGADISEAADVAVTRFAENSLPGAFLQADIVNLPFKPGSVDAIFSEGVLHHTDSTFGALKSLTNKLKVGGRFLFYVYKKKGPIREFTDDFIRDQMQKMTPQEGWDAMMPLTELGDMLGKLNIEVDVPNDIALLQIPKGRINLQRLFYWHVFKAFHHSDFTLDEMNHINFDWYAPANAYRQSSDEIRGWCKELGLSIEREVVEDAGVTVIARREA